MGVIRRRSVARRRRSPAGLVLAATFLACAALGYWALEAASGSRLGGAAAGAAVGAAAATAADASTDAPPAALIHTLLTSNGSPYLNWQTRVAYATYLLSTRRAPRHAAFTRVLHRGAPDGLEGEVPTWRVPPRDPACDAWCAYPVAERAYAVAAFLAAAAREPALLKGAEWLYLTEPDYVWAGPLAAPRDAELAASAAAEELRGWAHGPPWTRWAGALEVRAPAAHPEAMGRLLAEASQWWFAPAAGVTTVADLPAAGPAPALMHWRTWAAVAPGWAHLTAFIEKDTAAAKEELGWVREYYAFAVAAAVRGVRLSVAASPGSPFICQPPVGGLGAAHAFHAMSPLTLVPADGGGGGAPAWVFDKRLQTHAANVSRPARLPPPPPFRPGAWRFAEGPELGAEAHATIAAMVDRINEGVAALAPLEGVGGER